MSESESESPSIIQTAYPSLGPRGARADPSWRWAKAGFTLDGSPVHLRTQIETENHSCSHSHLRTIQSPINLTACLWTVGGSWRTGREPMLRRGEHANSTQKDRPPTAPRQVLQGGVVASTVASQQEGHGEVWASWIKNPLLMSQ